MVQGVGFRWWARETATELGLKGTVRNDQDGSVRLDVRGDTQGLDRFEALLARGPSGARVTAVQSEEPGTSSLPDRFEITR